MHVLVVDDDPTTTRVLSLLCQGRGHTIAEAPDAVAAWVEFRTRPPALILLDWLLPGTDGVTLCRQMRAHPGGDRPVIVMVTGQDQPSHLQQMLDAGADDYMPKPIEPAQFAVRMTIAERRAEQREVYRQASAELAKRRGDALKLGADIQRTFLLGHVPAAFPGLEIAAGAAAAQEVSGDFYDFWPHPEERALDVVVGDVAGKGVAAALLGAAVKAQLVRALGELALGSHTPGAPGPLAVVERVRAAMTADLQNVSQFFTLLLARIDLVASRLTFVNCGHPPLLVLRRGAGACEYLSKHDTAVGFPDPDPLSVHEARIGVGDICVLYSDGVTEARRGGSWEGDELGTQRLGELVFAHRERPVAEILDAVQLEVAAHASPAAPGDDVTVVVLRIQG